MSHALQGKSDRLGYVATLSSASSTSLLTIVNHRFKLILSRESLPDLPTIQNPDVRRRVFTHRSYFARPTHIFEDPPNDPSPDNEMLVIS